MFLPVFSKMQIPVLAILLLGVVLPYYLSAEAFKLSLDAIVPRYAVFGGDTTLVCHFKFKDNEVHKVEWWHNDKKVFQFVRNRRPEFTNHSVVGAEVDWSRTNNRNLTLKNLTMSASGLYFCDLAIVNPMYSQSSVEKSMTVMKPQIGGPYVTVGKDTYVVGEILKANCSSGKSTPIAYAQWLVNGEPVPYNLTIEHVYPYHMETQLNLPLSIKHYPQLKLECVATIPPFLGVSVSKDKYGDYRAEKLAVNVTVNDGGYVASANKKIILFGAVLNVAVFYSFYMY